MERTVSRTTERNGTQCNKTERNANGTYHKGAASETQRDRIRKATGTQLKHGRPHARKASQRELNTKERTNARTRKGNAKQRKRNATQRKAGQRKSSKQTRTHACKHARTNAHTHAQRNAMEAQHNGNATQQNGTGRNETKRERKKMQQNGKLRNGNAT